MKPVIALLSYLYNILLHPHAINFILIYVAFFARLEPKTYTRDEIPLLVEISHLCQYSL